MRIISKFHDYYDGVQSLGYDPDLNYIRKTVEREGEFFDSSLLCHVYDFDKDTTPNLEFEFGIVGFCGNLYQVLRVTKTTRAKFKIYHCYSIEDVDKIARTSGKSFFKYYFYTENKYNIFSRKRLEMFFQDEFFSDPKSLSRMWYMSSKKGVIKNGAYLKQLFFEEKVPVFVVCKNYPRQYDSQKIILNPCLYDWDFQKVKDSYTAYQEIAQYISGVLGVNSPETVSISDEDMKWEKGFDDWSFKKEEHTRKSKRK